MNFIENIGKEEIINFFKMFKMSYNGQKVKETKWIADEIIEYNKQKKITLYLYVKPIDKQIDFDIVDIKIDCLINPFDIKFKFSGLIEKGLEFSIKTEKYASLINKWCRFVYNRLNDEEKNLYLINLEKYIKSNRKLNLTNRQIKHFVLEVKNDLSFGSIEFFRGNEVKLGGIIEESKIEKQKEVYVHYFANFDVDIKKMKKINVMTKLELNKENIELLQKRLVFLKKYYNEQAIDVYLQGLFDSAVGAEKIGLMFDNKKYINVSSIEKIRSKYQKLIEQVRNIDQSLEEEVLCNIQQYNECCDLLKQYNNGFDYLNLMENYNKKFNTFLSVDKLEQINNILNKENELEKHCK